ncbi:hypothetical protein, partial [Microbacterium sp.]|uniref:hypothetical protein n=1 Tax=Microbacterium sp. TaxID=51671 RepID=UPI003A877A7A
MIPTPPSDLAHHVPNRRIPADPAHHTAGTLQVGIAGTSAEAINGRLEHLRGSALGLRNLTHHIARSLLE